MTAIIVTCSHCSRPTRLDSDALPDRPAFFPCPGCKQKVGVDKKQLLSRQPTPAASSPPPPPLPSTTPAPAAPAPPAAPATFASSAPAGRKFPKLPADATFPSGIILGENEALVSEVQQSLAALGSETELVSSPDVARQLIINEQPELCVYVGGQIPDPPYSAMTPLTGLPPNFRRRLFLVLMADNLKTLDGNAAFLYQVNLIVARQDFPQLGPALYSGIDYHERLYKSYFQAAEDRGSI